jgi:hypothetical protein
MYVNELVRAAAENIAHGESLPLSVLPAAIPYFSVRLSALCVEKRELDVLQEFVLRAIERGLTDEASIAGFLGTRYEEVAAELAVLLREYFISRKAQQGAYVLTEKGLAAIGQTGLRRVVEREVACYLNGVTRNVEQVSDLLTPRRRVADGTVFLPAVPARAPKIRELDVAGVRTAMMTARTPLPRLLEITRLGRIVRTSSLFLPGHLLLRRGSHGVPVICVQGSQNSELARILGGHPAIQGIKASMESDEKRARSFIRKRVLKSLNITLAPASMVREALTHLVAYADAAPNESAEKRAQFLGAAAPLLKGTHWIASVEWHLLFAKLTSEVSKRLLVVVPPFGPLFGLEELEASSELVNRGVDVEWVMSEQQVRLFERDDELLAALKKVKVTAVSATGDACGFCCDRKYLVVAMARDNPSSIGRYDSLFGVYVPEASNPEELLRACAQSSGWEVGLESN